MKTLIEMLNSLLSLGAKIKSFKISSIPTVLRKCLLLELFTGILRKNGDFWRENSNILIPTI